MSGLIVVYWAMRLSTFSYVYWSISFSMRHLLKSLPSFFFFGRVVFFLVVWRNSLCVLERSQEVHCQIYVLQIPSSTSHFTLLMKFVPFRREGHKFKINLHLFLSLVVFLCVLSTLRSYRYLRNLIVLPFAFGRYFFFFFFLVDTFAVDFWCGMR